MIPTVATPPRFNPRPWNKSLDLLLLVILFCALLAAILTIPSPSLTWFGRWLLKTESVGIIGCLCGISLNQIPWLKRHRPVVAHFYVSLIAIPVGYLVGSSIAHTILQDEIPAFAQGPRRLVALAVTGLATAFVLYLDAMRERVVVEAAARSEAQRLAVESQLRALRAQLQPHMLFNTLANVRSLVDVDPKLAQQMLDQLIAYLRSALAASREDSTSLRNEFAQLRAYLEIMSIRMGTRLKYQLDLPETLQHLAVPAMLLQPLVENAIKHGLEPKVGSGEVIVSAREAGDTIEIAVTDSGLGLPADDDRPESTSYGLVHVRERLRTFYGPRASLTLLRNEPQGVRAVVSIPK